MCSFFLGSCCERKNTRNTSEQTLVLIGLRPFYKCIFLCKNKRTFTGFTGFFVYTSLVLLLYIYMYLSICIFRYAPIFQCRENLDPIFDDKIFCCPVPFCSCGNPPSHGNQLAQPAAQERSSPPTMTSSRTAFLLMNHYVFQQDLLEHDFKSRES